MHLVNRRDGRGRLFLILILRRPAQKFSTRFQLLQNTRYPGRINCKTGRRILRFDYQQVLLHEKVGFFPCEWPFRPNSKIKYGLGWNRNLFFTIGCKKIDLEFGALDKHTGPEIGVYRNAWICQIMDEPEGHKWSVVGLNDRPIDCLAFAPSNEHSLERGVGDLLGSVNKRFIVME